MIIKKLRKLKALNPSLLYLSMIYEQKEENLFCFFLRGDPPSENRFFSEKSILR